MKVILLALAFFTLAGPVEAAVVTLTNGVIEVGVDTSWGGVIKTLGPVGHNYLNTFDSCRFMGVSVYDDADLYQYSPGNPAWGWNQVPVNQNGQVNEVLALEQAPTSLYTKAHLVDWNASRRSPKAADVIFEQWLTLDPSNPKGLSLKYRLTHEGRDYHATRVQELPYIYLSPELTGLVTLDRDLSLGNSALFAEAFSGLPLKTLNAPAGWVAAIDENGYGLAIGAPGLKAFKYTRHDGAPDFRTNYLTPDLESGYPPQSVREFEFKIYLGLWQEAVDYFRGLKVPTITPSHYGLSEDGQYLMISNNSVRYFPSMATLALYISQPPTRVYSRAELSPLSRQRLFRVADRIYYITEQGSRRLMAPSAAALRSYGNVPSDVVEMNPAELTRYPEIKLIKVPGEPAIYLIENGQKRHIKSWALMRKYEYDKLPIAPVSKIELGLFPDGPAITR